MHFLELTCYQHAIVPIPCFLLFFLFQKSYTGNIIEIGRNKSRTSYYLTKLPEDRRGDEGGPRAGHTVGRRGQPLARAPYV
jgi:hypothetical protein